MVTPRREVPGPQQESVWDYPRPPRIERSTRRVQVWLAGSLLADTTNAIRILETYHPPSWYLPPEDVHTTALKPLRGSSYCEWKGHASYFDVGFARFRAERAAWTYVDPSADYAVLASHVAFFPNLVECFVDGVCALAQEGGFYGGWITPDVSGPFKGSPGMDGW